VEKEQVFLSGGTYFFAIFSKFTHCQGKRQRAGREILAKGKGDFSLMNQVSRVPLELLHLKITGWIHDRTTIPREHKKGVFIEHYSRYKRNFIKW
jgi:hypothetical protein